MFDRRANEGQGGAGRGKTCGSVWSMRTSELHDKAVVVLDRDGGAVILLRDDHRVACKRRRRAHCERYERHSQDKRKKPTHCG